MVVDACRRRPRPIGLDVIFYLGAVAQLGERLICIQEVAGSIPTSSTSLTGPVARVASP
jgi:hypothetical protein